jgi:hypothetical protein
MHQFHDCRIRSHIAGRDRPRRLHVLLTFVARKIDSTFEALRGKDNDLAGCGRLRNPREQWTFLIGDAAQSAAFDDYPLNLRGYENAKPTRVHPRVVAKADNLVVKLADRAPALLDRMIAEGKLGVKSGAGFYTYPNPAFSEPRFLDTPVSALHSRQRLHPSSEK